MDVLEKLAPKVGKALEVVEPEDGDQVNFKKNCGVIFLTKSINFITRGQS